MNLKQITSFTTSYPNGLFYCENELSSIFSCKEVALKYLKKYKELYFFVPVVKQDFVERYFRQIEEVFTGCKIEKIEHNVQSNGLTYLGYKITVPEMAHAVYDVLLFSIKYSFSLDRQIDNRLSILMVKSDINYYKKYHSENVPIYGYKHIFENIRQIIDNKVNLPITENGLFRQIQVEFHRKTGPIYSFITSRISDQTLLIENGFAEKFPTIVHEILLAWYFSTELINWILSGSKVKTVDRTLLENDWRNCRYEFKNTKKV